MSTHAIEIVEIGKIEPHPNPEVERMELTRVWGWQCCIGKGQFKEGDRVIYVPPDFLVPLDRPEFAFLRREDGKAKERIRVRRFKGTLSQGLLIQLPANLAGLPVGTNIIEQLGIERYEPPSPKSTSGQFVSGPSGLYAPKFDVESYQRYRHLIQPGEEIVITEKLHGASARYCLAGNKEGECTQFCGSRTNWMADDPKNIWWMAFRQNPGIALWCQANPGIILYGEVFGQVQSLKYGARQNDVFFAAFAILDKDRWLDWDEFTASVNQPYESYGGKSAIKQAPVIYRGPFDEAQAYALAECDSAWPGACHIREGVVVLPIKERTDEGIGRVVLKIVGNRYLEKS